MDIEEQIVASGATAPRVTPDMIDQAIIDYQFVGVGTLTICVLKLRNGFTVVGESACVSPENYRKEIGERLSYQEAKNKVWQLEGYALAERILEQKERDAAPGMPESRIAFIARVAHEINRAYCRSMGDLSQVYWGSAPQWQRDSAISGVKFHLENPDATPESSHENWLREKEAAGWKYGSLKDPEKKEHPCFRPYAELPTEQRAKDYIFKAVVDALR